MYLNTKYIKEKGLSLFDMVVLQLIKQQRTEDLEEEIATYLSDDMLIRFEEGSLVEQVKGKKSDSEIGRLRTTKKANKILDNIEVPDINEDDSVVAEWLKNLYLKEGKEVGNFKNTKKLISQFRVHSGIERNNLLILCKSFMSDETEWKYSQRLEYLFWKKEHMYNSKFDINSSRLYQYYLKNKETFEKQFEKWEQ